MTERIKVEEIISALGWYPDQVNDGEAKYDQMVSQILHDYNMVEDILTGKVMLMGTGDYEERRKDHEIVNRLRDRLKQLEKEYNDKNPNQNYDYYGVRANKINELQKILGEEK